LRRGRSSEASRSALARPDGVEARLLLLAQQSVEVRHGWAHGSDRLEHGAKPLLHGIESRKRGGRNASRTRGLHHLDRLRRGTLEIVERAALGIGRPYCLLDTPHRALRKGRPLLAAAELRRIAAPRITLRRRARPSDGIETHLLVIAQRVVKGLCRRAYNVDR